MVNERLSEAIDNLNNAYPMLIDMPPEQRRMRMHSLGIYEDAKLFHKALSETRVEITPIEYEWSTSTHQFRERHEYQIIAGIPKQDEVGQWYVDNIVARGTELVAKRAWLDPEIVAVFNDDPTLQILYNKPIKVREFDAPPPPRQRYAFIAEKEIKILGEMALPSHHKKMTEEDLVMFVVETLGKNNPFTDISPQFAKNILEKVKQSTSQYYHWSGDPEELRKEQGCICYFCQGNVAKSGYVVVHHMSYQDDKSHDRRFLRVVHQGCHGLVSRFGPVEGRVRAAKRGELYESYLEQMRVLFENDAKIPSSEREKHLKHIETQALVSLFIENLLEKKSKGKVGGSRVFPKLTQEEIFKQMVNVDFSQIVIPFTIEELPVNQQPPLYNQ